MVLKLSVLLASILQVVAAATLNIGTFDTTERTLQVFIQPAGWAFSIWGLIYLFSFVYAVYQIIPKNDNRVLVRTRVPALIAFVSSIAWLYFAGSGDWQTWFTAPVLFLMAIALVWVVKAPDGTDKKQTLLSKKVLYPYAAWTGIACWLNIITLLTDKGIITTESMNVAGNLILFGCVAAFTLYYFRATKYSIFYGGVMIWAGVGVVAANMAESGMLMFALLGGLLSLLTFALSLRHRLRD